MRCEPGRTNRVVAHTGESINHGSPLREEASAFRFGRRAGSTSGALSRTRHAQRLNDIPARPALRRQRATVLVSARTPISRFDFAMRFPETDMLPPRGRYVNETRSSCLYMRIDTTAT
jgi:hypothetical protein